DDPTLDMAHPKHRDVAWQSCIYDGCPRHIGGKTSHDFFPRRYGNQDIPIAYELRQMKYYVLEERVPQMGGAIFKQNPNLPAGCIKGEVTCQECPEPKCTIHGQEKANEWHRYRNRIHLRPTRDAGCQTRSTSGFQSASGFTKPDWVTAEDPWNEPEYEGLLRKFLGEKRSREFRTEMSMTAQGRRMKWYMEQPQSEEEYDINPWTSGLPKHRRRNREQEREEIMRDLERDDPQVKAGNDLYREWKATQKPRRAQTAPQTTNAQ